jgi:cytochrome c oxidase assembly protein subunit 11
MHRLAKLPNSLPGLRCRTTHQMCAEAPVSSPSCCKSKVYRRFFSDDVHRRQQAALDFYKRKRQDTLYYKLFGNTKASNRSQHYASASMEDRNVQIAWYAAAVVVGALGATYAAVPLYKVFCQTTGFGGTTQRVRIEAGPEEGSVQALFQAALDQVQLPAFFGNTARVHTWTDEDAAARLASLKPVKNADLVTIRFDTTVGDVLPWSFVPVQLDVKVVPGETALSFFRVTNHSDKAITGVATYNVHPPKVGLYFQKIQCFCFEEQRLLPGETVDMPVFFFIDPDFLKDPQVSYVRSVTLSYTFFQTDVDDDDDDDEEEEVSA